MIISKPRDYARLVPMLIGTIIVAPSALTQTSDTTPVDEEVIVTAPGLEETIPLDLQQFGNRVEIITAEELRLGGFNDIGQSLQMKIPGLYIAPKNGAFDYMNCSLQGSRCQDILWLIDGVRINNRLYNSTSPLDTVPVHMVERIEVLYGGQGIFYGTQSVAGVVNVVTKSFSNLPVGTVSLSLDGNGGTHANVGYQTTLNDHQFVLYASNDEASGFQPFKNQDYQPSGTDRDRGYDVLTAGIKYGYSFNPDSLLRLHYHRTDNEVEFAAPSNRAHSFNERAEDLLTAKWDYAVNDNIELFIKGYRHQWNSHWTQLDNELDEGGNLTGNILTKSNREFWGYDDYGLTAMTQVQTNLGFDYAVGYEHQKFSGRDDVLLIADQTESVNAFFGQIRTNESFLDNSRLAFGLRHNRPSGEGKVTVGNLSMRHDFTGSFYFRGSAGTSFRLPDAWQLYGNDSCCTLGNPNLEGEKSKNTNVALGGIINVSQELTWEFILFKREVDNLIGTANGMRINTDNTVDFDGWELTVGLTLSPSWTATFDYIDTRAKSQDSGEQVADIPESLFKANLQYQPASSPYALNVSFLNVGNVYDDVSGGIGRIEHGGYTVVDLGGAYYFGDAQQHSIRVRLENALDKEYATSLGRAYLDLDGSSYLYENLGTPQTVHISYDYRF